MWLKVMDEKQVFVCWTSFRIFETESKDFANSSGLSRVRMGASSLRFHGLEQAIYL